MAPYARQLHAHLPHRGQSARVQWRPVEAYHGSGSRIALCYVANNEEQTRGVASFWLIVKGGKLKNGMELVTESLYYSGPGGSSHHAMPPPPSPVLKCLLLKIFLGRTLLIMQK